ncbi:thioredoxin domain-containing protein [Desulfovibrio sulfodismutans]|uniref:Thioredoxin domain-containing protein n=1 Tax=Desulfolutivibrio sulfodismutans TaxID=63561 RepID=A0A7K3NPJ5_9BACT|nr:DsbA family protein [Desulfolutivibrio sulfodismutans]NDY57725.1 thioredoxin domain-containing protein [Desulfolutivibrio sulfodismutans]QLA11618.1 thioredoxin domain-containing protein [Desulfolutivibrio sulfodismutans DSM 3696]
MAKRRVIVALLVIFGFSVVPARGAQNVEAEMRTLLKEHPEILLEALRKEKAQLLGILEEAAQERQQAEEKRRIEEEMKNPLKPVLDPGRLSLGKADAPVVVVEYSDFFCHYCAAGAGIMKELIKTRPEAVKVVFKHFAAAPVSRQAALIFEALGLQKPELAWAFHDAVFANQEKLAEGGEAALRELAVSLGADAARLDADMKRPELDERLKKDVEEARAFKFRGTPTYVVGGMSIRGAAPLPVFEEAVDKAVQNAKSGAAAPGGKEAKVAANGAAGKDNKECTDCREIK